MGLDSPYFNCAFPEGSPEYVKLHGDWCTSQGLPHTAILKGWEKYDASESYYWADRCAYFPINGTYLFGVDVSFYCCSKCEKQGVKLWRQSHTFLNHINLLCARCVRKKGDSRLPDSDGLWVGEEGFNSGRKSDQINGCVPAVPTEDGSYWGYTSVPDPAIRWWKALASF